MSGDDGDVDLSEKMKSINLKSDVNILLLGESGVGKSTFVNAIVNYLHFRSFKNAEKNNLQVLIPAEFCITDKFNKPKTVLVGAKNDKNENLNLGESATQDVQTFVFPIYNGHTKVRFIDTPGLGDTRGFDQDDSNCESILAYLGKLHELHAIAILLKSTNTRLNPGFEYCINKILSQLDKSAANNILFCFTNCRGANYTAGDTYALIEKVIAKIKNNPPHVVIPFDKNKFCFDNESFRYLAAVKNNVQFDDEVRKSSMQSWFKSSHECWNMLKYIVGDASTKPLTPHMVKNTVSINETRRMINQLSQPMLDISQNIENNIRILERHKVKISETNKTVDELKRNLFMPVINLETTKLTQPVTVCSDKKCVEIIKIEGINSTHYKTRCHDPCYLTNVQKEMVGDPGLIHCAAMNSQKNCNKCTCSFMVHMHIYYMTKKVSGMIEDKNIQKNISNREQIIMEIQKVVSNCESRIKKLNEEHQKILQAAAMFAHFLQKNAITPFNDAYANYINYLIKREESLGPAADQQCINHLINVRNKYDEIKKAFDNALACNINSPLTPKQVKDKIEELFKLEINGDMIKNLYKCQNNARKKEHEFTEYTHKMPPHKSTPPNKNASSMQNKQKVNKKPNVKKQQDDSKPPSYSDLYAHHSSDRATSLPPDQSYGPPPSGYPPYQNNYPPTNYRPNDYPPPHSPYPYDHYRGEFYPPPGHHRSYHDEHRSYRDDYRDHHEDGRKSLSSASNGGINVKLVIDRDRPPYRDEDRHYAYQRRPSYPEHSPYDDRRYPQPPYPPPQPAYGPPPPHYGPPTHHAPLPYYPRPPPHHAAPQLQNFGQRNPHPMAGPPPKRDYSSYVGKPNQNRGGQNSRGAQNARGARGHGNFKRNVNRKGAGPRRTDDDSDDSDTSVMSRKSKKYGYDGDIDLSEKMNSMNLKSDVNILLLGESGVGKSTFVNAIVNYLHFRSFKNAEKNDLQVLIPTEFCIIDKFNKPKTVSVGANSDKNENLNLGESATQDVHTYVFPLHNGQTNVRLIDTPGLGDTRGFDQDDSNCESILAYLGKLHELHAIAILLKSTNTRLNPGFEYCINKILSQLDKSAANNILFCFTNCRGSNYTPGDTYALMEKVIAKIKNNPPHVVIPFDKNKFCFDNESFRYLAAVKNNVQFDDEVRKSSMQSWLKSSQECWNMLKYIVGDANTKPLKPHMVKNTVSINETRRIINQLSQPMLDISENIDNNIRILERHKMKISETNKTVNELKRNLFIPVINLETIKLIQPVTVCSDKKCVEIIKIEGFNSIHYKSRCHDPCYLTNVAKEMVGDAGLVDCAAMNSQKICNKCKCSFMVHMHIYYMTKKVSGMIEDKNIQKNISNRQQILMEILKIVSNCENRIKKLYVEHQKILHAAAMFAHFLHKNAITPFNDAYANYINYLIKREESLGPAADQQCINHLIYLRNKYDEMKKAFDNALACNISSPLTPKQVKDKIEELFKLEINGDMIKNLYKCQNNARKKEHEFTEYTHKMPPHKSTPPNKNAFSMQNKQKVNKKPNVKKEQDYSKPASCRDLHARDSSDRATSLPPDQSYGPPPSGYSPYQKNYPAYPTNYRQNNYPLLTDHRSHHEDHRPYRDDYRDHHEDGRKSLSSASNGGINVKLVRDRPPYRNEDHHYAYQRRPSYPEHPPYDDRRYPSSPYPPYYPPPPPSHHAASHPFNLPQPRIFRQRNPQPAKGPSSKRDYSSYAGKPNQNRGGQNFGAWRPRSRENFKRNVNRKGAGPHSTDNDSDDSDTSE
ncbi:uncharacterized protein LOC109608186 [Aethina tumida]|uniref:uncharacterized protein LOC109608186 n=1 Tax=Aethina tumida TaxID=116153 RepID=UPI0021483227|nr:uncharacterized protein LOC109608186 [Aethina tumida]